MRRGDATVRCTLSVKSNRQLTKEGFDKEFVEDAWKQFRRPAKGEGQVNLFGLVVGAIDDSALQEWRDLQVQASSTTPERLVDRVNSDDDAHQHIETDSDLRASFLRMLTELTARQVPEALHLRHKVSEFVGAS